MPGYTVAPTSFGNNGPGGRGEDGRNITAPPRNVNPANPDLGNGEEETQANAPAEPSEWQERFRGLSRIVLLLAVLVVLAVPLVKVGRATARYRKATTPGNVAIAAFTQFQQEAADLARGRRPSEAATAYAERVSDSGTVSLRQALRLANLYEIATFSERPLAREDADEARRLAGNLRTQMWRSSSWWSRLRALFSIRSLRPS